jgi:nucleoside-diphosphate-sugar epimerase
LPWSELAGKTVLISGANSFIAAYVVETLLYLNDRINKTPTRIICLVRNEQRAAQRFSQYGKRKDLVFWVQDVCDPIRHQEKVDYIIHAASHATPSKYGIDPVGTLLPNVLGTYQLLEFARINQINGFLFISAGEVYSNLPSGSANIKEQCIGRIDPLALRSCYVESKMMGETMCISWSHQYGIPVKIVRLFHTYGPGMILGDGRVHSDFVGSMVNHKHIIIKSDGRATRTFCYVADTVAGFFTVLLKGSINEAYNVGSSHALTIQHFAETLVKFFPEQKVKIIHDRRTQGNTYLPSTNRLLRPNLSKIMSLGWRQKYSLKAGMERTVASYFPEI